MTPLFGTIFPMLITVCVLERNVCELRLGHAHSIHFQQQVVAVVHVAVLVHAVILRYLRPSPLTLSCILLYCSPVAPAADRV